jgi:hypothetical protein
MSAEPILTIYNQHTVQDGTPPSLSNESPALYVGYFENRFGEQWIFTFEKTATFYETAFGLQRVRELDGAVMLSDGVVSLAVDSCLPPQRGGPKRSPPFRLSDR